MTVYAQNGCTLATITDVKEIYPYYYLASTSIDSGAAPHNNAIPEIQPDTIHSSGSRSVTIIYNGNSYVWNDVEPSLIINNNIISNVVGQLYVVECTIFSDGSYNWGPLMTSSTYAAAKAAYNNAIAAKEATDLLGGHFIYKSTNTIKQDIITTPSGAGVIQTINDDPEQWGYNTWIGSNGIQLRRGETADATLNANGLILNKGGIEGGDSNTLVGTNGYVYLSTEDKPGITINGYTPGTNDPKWRQIIGSKFGVDSEGNLYAAGAHIDGNIIAQSLQIGSGANSYNGIAAINISGYDIEITSDSTGVIDSDNTTYLYPHLYHNGVEVTTGLDYDDFIWYQDDIEPGTAGDANNQGRYLATYGHNYRVVYDFDDGAVGGGTQIQTRTIDPSKYITKINDTGITIHPEVWTNQSSYIQLDGTGMELFNSSGNSIAKYGSSIRIGLNNSSRFLINNNSLQAYDNNNNKYFEFSVNGAQIGKADGAHTVIDEDGMQIYSVNRSNDIIQLANIGYGEGVSASGTSNAPYYTFGYRRNATNNYSASQVYGVGAYCIYNDKEYICKTAITTPEAWTSSHWQLLKGNYSVAEGYLSIASGYASHAEGTSKTMGQESHAEGAVTLAKGNGSHSEGTGTKAVGTYSHAEGASTVANYYSAHSEGVETTANGYATHAEGMRTEAIGDEAHAEGYESVANGYYSHAQNYYTQSEGKAQTVIGRYNKLDTGCANNLSYGDYAFIIGNGNGTSDSARSNALTVDWDGNVSIAGTLTQSSDRRLKEHISYLDKDAINFVQKLKPAYFKKDEQPHVGFYAQDIEENDSWHCMVGEMNGFKTLGYTEIIAPLVAYCQHLEERIKQLEEK